MELLLKNPIAFFDLGKNSEWHETLTAHDLPGIGNRLKNKSTITEEQNKAIELFIQMKEEQLE